MGYLNSHTPSIPVSEIRLPRLAADAFPPGASGEASLALAVSGTRPPADSPFYRPRQLHAATCSEFTAAGNMRKSWAMLGVQVVGEFPTPEPAT